MAKYRSVAENDVRKPWAVVVALDHSPSRRAEHVSPAIKRHRCHVGMRNDNAVLRWGCARVLARRGKYVVPESQAIGVTTG